jgi:hypothetical protein
MPNNIPLSFKKLDFAFFSCVWVIFLIILGPKDLNPSLNMRGVINCGGGSSGLQHLCSCWALFFLQGFKLP